MCNLFSFSYLSWLNECLDSILIYIYRIIQNEVFKGFPKDLYVYPKVLINGL